MFKLERHLFSIFFKTHRFPFRPTTSFFLLSNPNFLKFTTHKLESQPSTELSNPIIDKEDQSEASSPPSVNKNAVIEQDLYSYEATSPKIDSEDPDHPFVYPSKYGLLKLIACPVAPKQLNEIKGIHYFNDKTSTNYLKKILKSDKKCLLLFEPDTHYKNLSDLFKSIEKTMKCSYFGTKKKPRNPFSHCKTPKEIFNLNRRILIEVKQSLNKIVFMINYDGSVRLKGNFPSLNQLKLYLTRQFKDPKEPFLRHDYLIPYNIYKGMASAEAFEKAGIPLKVLDEKKIYPLYGVWSPTKQGYLELVADYIEKNPKKMKDAKQAIDLGCGTGVLSMLLLLKGGLKKVFGVDKSLIAVRNSRLNAEILEVGDKFKGEIMNLGLDDEVIIKSLEKKKFPKKYDMIICNPPWIIASYVNEKKDLDNGVYDPEERLLKSSFNFASILMIFL